MYYIKGELHPEPEMSMFCALSQNYPNLFEIRHLKTKTKQNKKN